MLLPALALAAALAADASGPRLAKVSIGDDVLEGKSTDERKYVETIARVLDRLCDRLRIDSRLLGIDVSSSPDRLCDVLFADSLTARQKMTLWNQLQQSLLVLELPLAVDGGTGSFDRMSIAVSPGLKRKLDDERYQRGLARIDSFRNDVADLALSLPQIPMASGYTWLVQWVPSVTVASKEASTREVFAAFKDAGFEIFNASSSFSDDPWVRLFVDPRVDRAEVNEMIYAVIDANRSKMSRPVSNPPDDDGDDFDIERIQSQIGSVLDRAIALQEDAADLGADPDVQGDLVNIVRDIERMRESLDGTGSGWNRAVRVRGAVKTDIGNLLERLKTRPLVLRAIRDIHLAKLYSAFYVYTELDDAFAATTGSTVKRRAWLTRHEGKTFFSTAPSAHGMVVLDRDEAVEWASKADEKIDDPLVNRWYALDRPPREVTEDTVWRVGATLEMLQSIYGNFVVPTGVPFSKAKGAFVDTVGNKIVVQAPPELDYDTRFSRWIVRSSEPDGRAVMDFLRWFQAASPDVSPPSVPIILLNSKSLSGVAAPFPCPLDLYEALTLRLLGQPTLLADGLVGRSLFGKTHSGVIFVATPRQAPVWNSGLLLYRVRFIERSTSWHDVVSGTYELVKDASGNPVEKATNEGDLAEVIEAGP